MRFNEQELLLHICVCRYADIVQSFATFLNGWLPFKASVFVLNPRTVEEGRLTTTGPSVQGSVRNLVVDSEPWKLVPNSLGFWTDGFPKQLCLYVWSPRTGGPINDHRSKCTQGGGRRRALETGPKLPSGKVSLASSSVKQLLLVAEKKVAQYQGWVPCYLWDWQVRPPGPYFLTFLTACCCPPARMKANLGLTSSRKSDLQHRQQGSKFTNSHEAFQCDKRWWVTKTFEFDITKWF